MVDLPTSELGTCILDLLLLECEGAALDLSCCAFAQRCFRFLPNDPHYVEVSNDGKVIQFEVTK